MKRRGRRSLTEHPKCYIKNYRTLVVEKGVCEEWFLLRRKRGGRGRVVDMDTHRPSDTQEVSVEDWELTSVGELVGRELLREQRTRRRGRRGSWEVVGLVSE